MTFYYITFHDKKKMPKVFGENLEEVFIEGAWGWQVRDHILIVSTSSMTFGLDDFLNRTSDWMGCWTGQIKEHKHFENEEKLNEWIEEQQKETQNGTRTHN